jgi:hypothetical protein
MQKAKTGKEDEYVPCTCDSLLHLVQEAQFCSPLEPGVLSSHELRQLRPLPVSQFQGTAETCMQHRSNTSLTGRNPYEWVNRGIICRRRRRRPFILWEVLTL